MSRRRREISAPDSPRAPRRSATVRSDAVSRRRRLVQEEVHVFWPSAQRSVDADDLAVGSTGCRVRRPTVDCHRPSLMRISQDRRDPNPARARVFCRRSPSSNYETRTFVDVEAHLFDSRLPSRSGHELFDRGRSSSAARPSGRGRVRSCHRGWVGPVPGATFFFDVLALLEESTHASTFTPRSAVIWRARSAVDRR